MCVCVCVCVCVCDGWRETHSLPPCRLRSNESSTFDPAAEEEKCKREIGKVTMYSVIESALSFMLLSNM